jgi:predicted O-methyltransferase YrrM
VDDRADEVEDAVEDHFDTIARLANAYWAPRVLLTAVELDLFSRLGGEPLSAAALAQSVGASERGIELIANALVGLGFLTFEAGRYAATPLSRRYLDTASPEHRGQVVSLATWWWTRWSDLTEVVRSGQSPEGPPPEFIEAFTMAMHQGKPEAGEQLVGMLDLHGINRIVDLGAGPGTFAEAFAAALPDAHIVIVDRPEVIAVARRRLPTDLLDTRITLVERDFLSEGIPLAGDSLGPYDLVLLSSVVHLLGVAENIDLFGRVYDVLEPGGQVVIRDFLVDDDGVSPVEATLFAIIMLVSTRAGRCYSFRQIKEWLHNTGFGEVEHDEFDGPVGLITARRA